LYLIKHDTVWVMSYMVIASRIRIFDSTWM